MVYRCCSVLFCLVFLVISRPYIQAQNYKANDWMEIKSIPIAHSHNDYTRKNPLFDALYAGFRSIEIDVFAHEGQLRVSHIALFLKRKPTIEERYVQPLLQILPDLDKVLQARGESLEIMVDLKTGGKETIALLAKALQPLTPYLSTWDSPTSIHKRSVTIVLSGGYPRDLFSYDMDVSMFFLDGRPCRCYGQPDLRIARVSAHYDQYFTWNGRGDMPKAEYEKLLECVYNAKRCHQKLRFWGMPQKRTIWRFFSDAGVEWINVDHIKRFTRFVQEK